MKISGKQKSNNNSSKLLVIVYLALILLRILGIIKWSWWLILSPIWGTILLVGFIIAGSFLSDWAGRCRGRKKQGGFRSEQ